MAFPYNQENQPLSEQGVLVGVAGVSAGQGVLKVSSITAGGTLSFDGDAANNRVSAFQPDAGKLLISAKQGDAALFRVSAIGGTAGDNVIVDGGDQSISATVRRVSAAVSSGDNGLTIRATNKDDAVDLRASALSKDGATFRVSAIIDNGSVSAKSSDAGTFLVSAKQGDAALFRVSAIGTVTVSAHEVKQSDAASLLTSSKQGDAALLRVSVLPATLTISAHEVKQSDAASMLVSGKQGDAGNLMVSAKSNDGALLRVSAIQGDGVNFNVSAKSSDAGTFLVSAKDIVDARAAGGASVFSTSAGIAVVSTIKSSGGRLYGWYFGNPAGVDQYVQLFNASAGATLGTDVPYLTLYIPTLGGANVPATGQGIGFANGIQVAVTSTAGGSTAGASAVRLNLFYA